MTRAETAGAVLERYGRTFADELGVQVERNTPSPLFRLLCYALLASAPIRHEVALQAARSLRERGWTTPDRLVASSWRERVQALDDAGYARYDESAARMLGETAALCVGRWKGDLRRLRDEANRDPERERRLLQEFPGIGEVGADLFLREAQVAWPELRPYADRRALDAARKLGLGNDADAIASLVDERDVPRLIAGLVRVDLAKAWDEVRA